MTEQSNQYEKSDPAFTEKQISNPNEDSSYADEEEEAFSANPTFLWCQVFLLVYSIGSYLADTALDIAVACYLYADGKSLYFGLTVAFIVIPNVVIMFFSFKWYTADQKLEGPPRASTFTWIIRFTLLLLQLGPVIRYMDSLRYAILFRTTKDPVEKIKFYKWMVYENADAALLRLFEAFLEAAPQTLLQIYIMTSSDGDHNPTTVRAQIGSCVMSVVSISWALSSQQRTMRLSQRNVKNPTFTATYVQALWFFFVTSSRMLALGLFASVFPVSLAIICTVRWIIMVIWLRAIQTAFCDTKTEEFFYKCVVAFIYIFCYLNPVNNRTRWRYVFYYTYMFIENSILIGLWHSWVDPQLWYRLPSTLAVFLSFFLGIAFMVIYYLLLHPTGAIQVDDCWPSSYSENEQQQTTVDSTCKLCKETNEPVFPESIVKDPEAAEMLVVSSSIKVKDTPGEKLSLSKNPSEMSLNETGISDSHLETPL